MNDTVANVRHRNYEIIGCRVCGVTDHQDIVYTMALATTLPQLRDAEMASGRRTPCICDQSSRDDNTMPPSVSVLRVRFVLAGRVRFFIRSW